MVFRAVAVCLASLSVYLQFTEEVWVLDEQHEINELQLFADHHDDVFWRDSLKGHYDDEAHART